MKVRESTGLDRLECLALAYLGLPLLVFLGAWFKPWVAVALLGALGFASHRVLLAEAVAPTLGLGWRQWSVLFVISMLWVGGSGLLREAGLPARLNLDWWVRLSAFYDLIHFEWPVTYASTAAGGETWLRFPLLHYLVPALVGKAVGAEVGAIALGLWTAGGVLLCLAMLTTQESQSGWARPLGFAFVWVMFSGMDLLGYLNDLRDVPAPGEHIEWWFPVLQYSSHTTQLFWVPNHALPGWIGAMVLWRHREAGLDALSGVLMLLLVGVSAPLPAIGLLPLVLLSSWQVKQSPMAWLRAHLQPAALLCLPVAALCAAFYLFGHHNHALPPRPEPWWLIPLWVRFAFFEWAALALVLLWCGQRGRLLWGAALVLVALPLFRYGPANDLVMRGGIAPLALLAAMASEALFDHKQPRGKRAVLALVLGLGMVTPMQEFIRMVRPQEQLPPNDKPFVSLWPDAPHYVGALPADSPLRHLLREPRR